MGFHPFLTIEPSSGLECEADAECLEGEECLVFGRQCAQAGSPCVGDDDCDSNDVCVDAKLCDRVYNGIDITIDVPLNQPMRIELTDPPLNISPADMLAYVLAETEKWGKVAKFAGIKPD